MNKNGRIEGFGRQTYKEKAQFYYLAKGSLTEVKNQVIIARDLEYVSLNIYITLVKQIEIVQKLLQGFIKSTKRLSAL